MAAILRGCIGVYVLVRFSLGRPPGLRAATTLTTPRSSLLHWACFGGFIDASGGGGWGTVRPRARCCSQGKTAPRTIIGSVSASEFLVAISASVGFAVGLREEFLDNLPDRTSAWPIGGVRSRRRSRHGWSPRISPALLGTAGRRRHRADQQPEAGRALAGIAGSWSTLIAHVTIVAAWAGLVVYAWRPGPRRRSSCPRSWRPQSRPSPRRSRTPRARSHAVRAGCSPGYPARYG